MTSNPNNSNLVLMLIDDSSFDLKINTRIVEYSGLLNTIIPCSSAREALIYLSENLDNPEKLPQLILLDIQMPEMDGFTLTRNIKQDPRFAGIPVVIHSSLTGSANEAHVRKVGADAYVAKFVAEDLAHALREALRTVH